MRLSSCSVWLLAGVWAAATQQAAKSNRALACILLMMKSFQSEFERGLFLLHPPREMIVTAHGSVTSDPKRRRALPPHSKFHHRRALELLFVLFSISLSRALNA